MADEGIAKLERERAELKEQIKALYARLGKVEAEITERKALAVDLGIGVALNKKNRRKLRFLALVKLFLSEEEEKRPGRGLSTKELRDRFVRNGVVVNESSFRSYLHRFQKEKFLLKESHGGPWRLPPEDHNSEEGPQMK